MASVSDDPMTFDVFRDIKCRGVGGWKNVPVDRLLQGDPVIRRFPSGFTIPETSLLICHSLLLRRNQAELLVAVEQVFDQRPPSGLAPTCARCKEILWWCCLFHRRYIFLGSSICIMVNKKGRRDVSAQRVRANDGYRSVILIKRMPLKLPKRSFWHAKIIP
jgi:hypothetical protein